ncbi:MAG: thioredoxin domain-containing protein [Candidatus Moranbacteria bacterium]|nr:thioredoxin domain-containing protein [Candidatus Moranbacteria bacterium]
MYEEIKKKNKKIKNLFSVVILLAGLLIGSLFVDVVQLMRGSGFSEKNLTKTEIFESNGKTWVAYTEPMVNIRVITDDSCEKCNPAEPLIWLRRVVPTISAQKIAADSQIGKDLAKQLDIKIIPAFIFSEAITKTDLYAQAQVLFQQKGKDYVLNTSELGLEPGKYLNLPSLNEGDATSGKADSKATVFVFSDFQCPYCKIFYTNTLRPAMKQYADKVLFVYKHLPLAFHSQANNTALASECAQEQNKFWEYADKLYTSQAEWSKLEGTQKFKDYAKLIRGIDTTKFNQCLDDKKFQDKIDQQKNEAASFGISATPAVFVNDFFKSGSMSLDELKKAIDEKLQ